MINYIIKRLLLVIPVLIGVSLIVSAMIHFIPGDPVELILGPYANDVAKVELAKKLGLDQSAASQSFHYLKNVVQGDWGVSLITNQPVFQIMMERIPSTVQLALTALAISMLVGVLIGTCSAIKNGTFIDLGLNTLVLIALAMPNFWFGPMLVLIFSIQLGWLPVAGKEGLLSYILPSLTLGLSLAAIMARVTRTSILENMKQLYVTVALSKGTSPFKLYFVHIMRNSLITIVTIAGLQFGVLLGGSIITEKIFDWPGLGSLIVDAINNRDYPLIQGCVLVVSLTYVLVNLFVDILYAVIDPRVSYEK